MLQIVKTKSELRKYAKDIRANFVSSGYLDVISSRIVQKILNSTCFNNAKHVGLYYPIVGEVNLLSLLNVFNKSYYFPRCKGDELEFVKYSSSEQLIENKWGIKEPCGDKINPEILDVIYIPALIANSKKFRLGYGKGYYDKFFALNKLKAKKIIVISKKLINDDFLEDDFDICADEIIFE